MLFTHKQQIFIISQTQLYWISNTGEVVVKDVPKELVSFGQILNTGKYEEFLEAWVNELEGVAKEVSILIVPQLVFETSIATQENSQETGARFTALTPIKESDKALLEKQVDGQTRVWVCDKHFFTLLSAVLEKHDISVEKVLPWSLVSSQGAEILTDEAKRNELLAEVKKLSRDHVFQLSASTSSRKKKTLPLWSVFIAVVVLAALGTVVTYLSQFLQVKDVSAPQATATPEATSTPSPLPTETPTPQVSKEQVILRVLNGTGRAGVARTLQEKLQAAGFTTVTTGNTSTGGANTRIRFAAQLDENILKELEEIVKEDYPTATSSQASELASPSAVIELY